MYLINYWVNKPILSEVIGRAETLHEAKMIIIEHDIEHCIDNTPFKENYFIREEE